MRRLGLLLAALALLGCSADADRPAADPPTPAATTEDTTTEDPPVPAEDPLRFPGEGGLTVISCFPDGERELVTFDLVRPRRPVTLTGVSGGGEAMQLGRSWIAPSPPGPAEESGVLDVAAGGTQLVDVAAWSGRRPLRGSELEPGTAYVFFVRSTVRPDRRLDDLLFAWDDGTSVGESRFDHAGRTRAKGC